MPNGPPAFNCRSGRPTGAEGAVTPYQYSAVPVRPPARASTNDSGQISPAESEVALRNISALMRTFDHYERNSPLVVIGRRHPWHNGRVTVAHPSFRIAL